MALIEEFNRSGNWLFKRRGYLPVILLVAAIVYMAQRDFTGYSIHHYHDIIYLIVSLSGLGVRILTIGQTPRNTSGRNIAGQKAEVLNTTGIYSLLRHPLYLGNFIIWLGIALFLESVMFIVLFVLVFWLYYERIMFAEEFFLREKFGRAYLEWAENTPAFLPKFRNWQASKLRFSWKNVLKREYNGFINIFITFTILDFARNYFSAGKPYPSLLWIYLVGAALVVWIVLRTLEKNTSLFREEGR
ncbi:MAG: DUF1295 domain-containing protein [Bacteroidales bacterium]|nr:MAG: DUF1295 domain-containing protein [Bacteroidales bacterium]